MTSSAGQARADRQAESRQDTTRTVLIAGGANIVVMIAKLVAGILSGSSAMLAEAAHSFADTLNQVFLFTSVRQGQRPADEDHPFGYGQERYFWSLLAAFGIFIAGAGFSIFEGILSLNSPTNDFLIAYVVLGVCAIAEGTSFIRAYGQLRGEAHRSHTGTLEHVKTSRDTTVKAALFEDTAAVIGLALAAGGLLLEQITGSPVYDGGASIAIGVLLIVVAFRLGMDSRELLIGRSADPKVLDVIREEIGKTPGVDQLLHLQTMHVGPDSLIVAARVALNDDSSAGQVEDLADDIDHRLSERLPVTPYVFIDPTQTAAGADGISPAPAGLRQRPPPSGPPPSGTASSPGRDQALGLRRLDARLRPRRQRGQQVAETMRRPRAAPGRRDHAQRGGPQHPAPPGGERVDERVILGGPGRAETARGQVGRRAEAQVGPVHVRVAGAARPVELPEQRRHPGRVLPPVGDRDRADDRVPAALGEAELAGQPARRHQRVRVRRGQPDRGRIERPGPAEHLGHPGGACGAHVPRLDAQHRRSPGPGQHGGPVRARIGHDHHVDRDPGQRRGGQPDRFEAGGQQVLLVVRRDDHADGGDHAVVPTPGLLIPVLRTRPPRAAPGRPAGTPRR